MSSRLLHNLEKERKRQRGDGGLEQLIFFPTPVPSVKGENWDKEDREPLSCPTECWGRVVESFPLQIFKRVTRRDLGAWADLVIPEHPPTIPHFKSVGLQPAVPLWGLRLKIRHCI